MTLITSEIMLLPSICIALRALILIFSSYRAMPILNMLISVPLKAPLADGSVDVTITVGVLNETGGG